MARMMAGGVSRRTVLRGLAAGLAGAAGLRARGAGAEQEKKPLCHATEDQANPWVVISVAEPAWPEHFGHGDRPFVDCCTDADCPVAGQTCGGGGVEGQCGAPSLCQNVVCTPLDDCHVAGTCDPATGICSNPNKADGTSCDDGDACTQTDTCQAGVCSGTLINCDDGDACTVDTCDASTGQCIHHINVCDDGIDCTIDSCDRDLGCVHIPEHSICGASPCMVPVCDPDLGCIEVPKVCPDGQVCSGGDCVPALLGFGADCTASSECASGVCACHSVDCDGGGQCAVHGNVCVNSGRLTSIWLPDGTSSTTCSTGNFVAFDCIVTPCEAGWACHNASGQFCVELAPS